MSPSVSVLPARLDPLNQPVFQGFHVHTTPGSYPPEHLPILPFLLSNNLDSYLKDRREAASWTSPEPRSACPPLYFHPKLPFCLPAHVWVESGSSG